MKRETVKSKSLTLAAETVDYDQTLNGLVELLDAARRSAARAVNAVMTATYWEIGRRIVEIEQNGKTRAEYGEEFLVRLGKDLTARFGRGFQKSNLYQMRQFYLTYQNIFQTPSGKFDLREISQNLPLSWSHYVKLLTVKTDEARKFYETEALRGGWTVRQLDRQINSLFYERALLSKDKAAMLKKGAKLTPADAVAPDEEIRDPFVLEFLDLKDEYSELELEEAIIKHLENFLLELGTDFTFVGRQKRLRIDDEWFRVDLVFYHRRLRCLILIDLKLGKLTHADIGQMHLYCNYAATNWTLPEENPPLGLILCSYKGEALAKYALEGLPNKILAREYLTLLPDEQTLIKEIERAQRKLQK